MEVNPSVYNEVMGGDDLQIEQAVALGRQMGKTETVAAILEDQTPVEWMFAKLRSPVVLSRNVIDKTEKKGFRRDTARLEPGDEVAVIDVDDNPRNRFPLRCTVRGWPDFFWLGRNVDLVTHFVIRGEDGFQIVEPPADEITPEYVPTDEEVQRVNEMTASWNIPENRPTDGDTETYGVQ